MTIAFTICSINYLAQAQALGESLLKHNPEYTYAIALLDKIGGHESLCASIPYNLLEVEKINIDGFEEMYSNYEITELNTAVKPFYIDYFLRQYPQATSVIYLDPDIVVFDAFTALEEKLQDNNIVLTPHFFTSIYDEKRLSEMDILNAGIYNLGFIAVTNTEESKKFVDWWKIKLRKYCRIALCEGMFVDQLWINFAPLYFDKVHIFRHLGYNMAYWNLHERELSIKDGRFFVNDTFPLTFYHYSGYSPLKPEILSKHQNRFSLVEREDVKEVFEFYRAVLLEKKYQEFVRIKCYYLTIYEERQREQKETQLKQQKEYEEKKRRLREEQIRKNRKLIPTLKRVVKRIYDLA